VKVIHNGKIRKFSHILLTSVAYAKSYLYNSLLRISKFSSTYLTYSNKTVFRTIFSYLVTYLMCKLHLLLTFLYNVILSMQMLFIECES